MKLKLQLLTVTLVVFLATAAVAEAGIVNPPLSEPRARHYISHFLGNHYWSWRYREAGSINCAGGRVNWSTWSCGVNWISGRTCKEGRVLIHARYRAGFNRYSYFARYRGHSCAQGAQGTPGGHWEWVE